MRILFSVLTLDKKKLESCVELDDGSRVKIDFGWQSKSDSIVPPRYWSESVLREAEHQHKRTRTPTTLSDLEAVSRKTRAKADK